MVVAMSDVIINTASGGMEIVLAIEVVRPNVAISIEGMGGGGSGGTVNPNAVLYTPQTLDASQQAQARQNIGAASATAEPIIAHVTAHFGGNTPQQIVVDKSFEELHAAAIAGRRVEIVEESKTFGYGTMRYYLASIREYEMRFTFRAGFAVYEIVLMHYEGKTSGTWDSTTLLVNGSTAPNPYSLAFTGSANAVYDGTENVVVNVADNWQDLKGKPFGLVGKDGYVFGPARCAFEMGGACEVPFMLNVEPGLDYDVSFDGETYSVSAQQIVAEETVAILMGNPAFAEVGEDNGMPFLIISAVSEGLSAIVYPEKADSIVTVAIRGIPKLVKMPTEYLPESLGAVGKANAGKLLYVDAYGALQPVTLGSGLQLVGGVLSVTGAVTPSDGTSVLGEAVLGDMILGG